MPRSRRQKRLKKEKPPSCSFWHHFALDGQVRGNVHDIQAVKITAGSNSDIALNGADVESYSLLQSENKLRRSISFDLKALPIKPTDDIIRTHSNKLIGHLNNQAVDDSGAGTS
jgi:hypothetical protein